MTMQTSEAVALLAKKNSPDDRVLLNAFGHGASKLEFDAITRANLVYSKMTTSR